MKKKKNLTVLSAKPPSERDAPAERALVLAQVQQSVISAAQFKVLQGETPPYAIQQRVGRAGKNFNYVKHGYVTDQLNRAFGFDWDFRLLPVFNGNIYQLTATTEEHYNERKSVYEQKEVRNLSVYGELTVRIRNPKNLEVIATVTKAGAGSQNWEKSIEFGDALKGATSDALKVSAMRLGVALDLYWDDQAERDEFEEKNKPVPPTLDADGKKVIALAEAIRQAGDMKKLLEFLAVPDLTSILKNGHLTAEATAKLEFVLGTKTE